MAAIFLLTVVTAQAQTCTTPEAQLISPTDGSTLQPDPGTGSINFTWCNASADYFVIIESIPGAHDIFFAFTGGAGGGAGQNFLDLGPACAPVPPTGCIPALGEHIYFTLDTVKAKQIIGSHQYNFTAPGTPGKVATATGVGAASASASTADQNVTLTATVTATSTVNQGTVTFQVLDGATHVGAAVTSANLATGSATATYLLPAGTVAKAYTIQATYSGGTNFDTSTGTGTLTVTPAPPTPLPTTTTVAPQAVTFSSAAQNVTLTAAVAAGSAVNEGTVTFQIMDGAANVGTAVTSATLSNGAASAIYALPAGLLANTYTIQATYSGGTNFVASSGSESLIVKPPAPPTQTDTATIVSNNAVTFSSGIQHVTLTAGVVPGATVNEGTVTFQVVDAASNPIGAAVPSATLTGGNASVSYALPAGTGANTYTIQAAYSGGPNFLASIGSGTLTINKAQSVTQFTSTAPASLPLNGTYTPTASSTGDGSLTLGASGSCSIANGVVTITASSGTCTVTATEGDGNNFLGSSATPQSITATPIPDAVPPVISVSANPKTLWPPDGGMVRVTVLGTITDAGSGVSAHSAHYAVADEYREVQPQGTIKMDSEGNYSFTVLLRAARRGDDMNGRTYQITVRAQDNAGNAKAESTVVTVPHDSRGRAH